MCRVDGEDRKHAHGGVFSVLALRGGEEDAEQPKCTEGRTCWLFVGRGRVKKMPNTKNAPPRARFSCLACGYLVNEDVEKWEENVKPVQRVLSKVS